MPRKKVDRVPNSLRYMRVRRSMSIETLSEITGIPLTTLHRLETGQPIGDYLLPLSTALKCDPREIMTQIEEVPTVPIIGLIKNQSYVKMLPKKEWRKAVRVEGLGTGVQAVRVVGEALKPHHGRNDVLYFHGEPEKNPKFFLERECLVDLPEGKRLLCWLSAGGKKGYYTLYPYAAMKPIFDQPLQNVYPVLHVKRS